MSHGNFANLWRVFAYAFQKILEIAHGRFFYRFPYFGQILLHVLTEPVVSYSWQVGVFQLLKGF